MVIGFVVHVLKMKNQTKILILYQFQQKNQTKSQKIMIVKFLKKLMHNIPGNVYSDSNFTEIPEKKKKKKKKPQTSDLYCFDFCCL
mmetsp:Transcript_42411/g.54552  ORF Transcript_42411/g.54552 Transcript_42411/m.54552 type:complete len:86 (-) Transcript_42411:70-327(-)